MSKAESILRLEQKDSSSIQAHLELNSNGVEHGHTRAPRSRADC